MRFLTLLFAILVVSGLNVGEATAQNGFYDPVTGRWEEVRSHRYGPNIPREEVAFDSKYAPGTIVVRTSERRLYLVLERGRAMRYGVGVGRPGFQWAGQHRVSRKAEWPSWTPTAAMRAREPHLPAFMPGGPENPMGARALYLGSSYYRIHGTNQAWSIDQELSSGCIRMMNHDVEDLYERVNLGALVIVER